MYKRLALQTLLGLVAALAAGVLQAHHSYAEFDVCERVAVRGEITSLSWVNPHVLVGVRDANAVTHQVVWFSLAQAAQAGVAEGTLRVGDVVLVTGTPRAGG